MRADGDDCRGMSLAKGQGDRYILHHGPEFHKSFDFDVGRKSMRRIFFVTLVSLVFGIVSLAAQDKPAATPAQDKPAPATSPSKPVIVVSAFTTVKEVAWPYDMKDMQKQTVAEMNAKAGTQYDVAAEAPTAPQGHVYTLNGELTAWRPGNRAKRMLVGVGSGRETAEIHYWLTDERGEKVFDNKDTIRAEFWGNAYAGSVGELAHPFADKISGRIKNAKLK